MVSGKKTIEEEIPIRDKIGYSKSYIFCPFHTGMQKGSRMVIHGKHWVGKSSYYNYLSKNVGNYIPIYVSDLGDIIVEIGGGDSTVLNVKATRASGHIKQDDLVLERFERLEAGFSKLVESTWNYVFSKEDVKEMKEISKEMMDDSKTMRELLEEMKDN